VTAPLLKLQMVGKIENLIPRHYSGSGTGQRNDSMVSNPTRSPKSKETGFLMQRLGMQELIFAKKPGF
jgi:hypothetical protein